MVLLGFYFPLILVSRFFRSHLSLLSPRSLPSSFFSHSAPFLLILPHSSSSFLILPHPSSSFLILLHPSHPSHPSHLSSPSLLSLSPFPSPSLPPLRARCSLRICSRAFSASGRLSVFHPQRKPDDPCPERPVGIGTPVAVVSDAEPPVGPFDGGIRGVALRAAPAAASRARVPALRYISLRICRRALRIGSTSSRSHSMLPSRGSARLRFRSPPAKSRSRATSPFGLFRFRISCPTPMTGASHSAAAKTICPGRRMSGVIYRRRGSADSGSWCRPW